jgi:hypothetical protein
LKLRFFLILAVFCLGISAPAPAAPVSASVPLDSWVYPALDKLAGLGLIDSALQGSRPYTRLEAARQVDEARKQLDRESHPDVAAKILTRLEREFAAEQAGGAAGGYLKPLRDFRLDYLYQNGEAAVIAPGPPGAPAQIASRQFPLNTNNFGIDYAEHHNGQASFESEARLGRSLLFSVRPLALLRQDDGADLRLLEGRAALGLGPVEFSVGRQSLWWGQGRHGSLVLTDNAKPLDMLRVNNPTPVLLPWIFKHLGPFRFDLFLSRLESDRVVPEPYFSGLRINIKPAPWLELGGSRAVMFGGEGRPRVGFDDFLTIVGGNNLVGDEDTSNSVAALDVRIRVPALGGAELYGEWGGEDEADLLGFIPFIANKALLVGVYLPRLEASGRLGLRLEHADLSLIDNNSPVWYRHGIYRSGYTYEGKILGHHAGGAAKDTFGELEILLPREVTVALFFDYEKRGYDQPVRETHRQPGIRLAWFMYDHLRLDLLYQLDSVSNFQFVAGNDQKLHFARAGMTFVW